MVYVIIPFSAYFSLVLLLPWHLLVNLGICNYLPLCCLFTVILSWLFLFSAVFRWTVSLFWPRCNAPPPVFFHTAVSFPIFLFTDMMPWSWEKILLRRPTALWTTLSVCCLSLLRLSLMHRWKQVGRHQHAQNVSLCDIISNIMLFAKDTGGKNIFVTVILVA